MAAGGVIRARPAAARRLAGATKSMHDFDRAARIWWISMMARRRRRAYIALRLTTHPRAGARHKVA